MMHRTQKKICHLQLLPIMSGVQRAMLEFLIRMDQSLYDISVICKEEGNLTKELEDLHIRYHIIPSLQREINLQQDLRALWQLYLLFKREKYDLIHTHSSKTGLLGRVAGRMAGVKYIFHTVHGLPFHEFTGRFRTFLYSFIERLAGKLTDKVIFVNNEERTYSIQNRILRDDQVQTIYNGVQFNRVALFNTPAQRIKIREQWHIRQKDFVVAFVGRLWEQKDPRTLAEIVSSCSNLAVHFLIVGDGPYFGYFSNAFSNHPQVTLTGWQNDCYQIYPAIDALILPSLWEGLSVTLIEAMAFGKPLIASNIKGNRECVFHGQNGILCSPKRAEEFKKAIEILYLDKSLYCSMASRCIEIAHQFFDIEQNTRRLLTLYQEQLENDE